MPRIGPKPVKALSWRGVVHCTRVGLAAPGSISDGLRAALAAAPRRHRPLLERQLGDLSAKSPDDEVARYRSDFDALLVEQPVPDNVTAFYVGLKETSDESTGKALRFHITGATKCDERADQVVRASDIVWPRPLVHGQLKILDGFCPVNLLAHDPEPAEDPVGGDRYEDWASPLQIFATVAAGRLLAHILDAAPRAQVLGRHARRACVAGFDGGELFVYADLTREGVVPRCPPRRFRLP